MDVIAKRPAVQGERIATRIERCSRSDPRANAAAFIWLFPDWKKSDQVPDYSGSYDAAYSLMTLLPEEFPWNLCTTSFYGRAYVTPNEPNSFGVSDPRKGEGVNPTNLPAAIAAAIIRAIAHYPAAALAHSTALAEQGEAA